MESTDTKKKNLLVKKFTLKIPVIILSIFIILGIMNFLSEGEFARDIGIVPRSFPDAWKILTAPFVHGNYIHLIYNMGLLFPLLIILYKFFRNHATNLLLNFCFWPYVFTWLVERPYTITFGSSGIGFALLTFLVSIGLIIGRGKLFYMSLILAILYSNNLFNWGFDTPGISWVTHLGGTITGLIFAFIYSPIRLKELK